MWNRMTELPIPDALSAKRMALRVRISKRETQGLTRPRLALGI
jgi:hypothetical protein